MQGLKSVTGQLKFYIQISHLSVNDLPRAKKVLSSIKNHEYNIKFSTLNQANIYLAVFHDASLGNLDGASQGAS